MLSLSPFKTWLSLCILQDVEIGEEVDVIISEWMGYMLLYEVILHLLFHDLQLMKHVYTYYDLFAFYSRACWEVSLLPEIVGLNLEVLYFLHMQRYDLFLS